MFLFIVLSVFFREIGSSPINFTTPSFPQLTTPLLKETRRILFGREALDTRPYMVYLRPAAQVETNTKWTCGGVIIHEHYILTSAACIEDVPNFYVISGTYKWIPRSETDNDCVRNGQKKAIWKCVPKDYFYDGNEFNNINWIKSDIAIVKVDTDFNFQKRVKGCDYIPKKIGYNNISVDFEAPKTKVAIAGWGTTSRFTDKVKLKSDTNSPVLLDTETVIISRKHCRSRWPARYWQIIGDGVVCTKDVMDAASMSELCQEELSCKELIYSNEDEEQYVNRRMIPNLNRVVIHDARHTYDLGARKVGKEAHSGGFCENDHGGPLIYGQGTKTMVVGIVSACQAKDVTKQCYGPFIHTSVYYHRQVISCAIYKITDVTCAMILRKNAVESTYEWPVEPRPVKPAEIVERSAGENVTTYTKMDLNDISKRTTSQKAKVVTTRKKQKP